MSPLVKALPPSLVVLLLAAAGCGTGPVAAPGGGNTGTSSNAPGGSSGPGGANGAGSATTPTGGGSANGAQASSASVITPPVTPASTGWYETLTAADCTTPTTAYPPARIWRLSATQWANTAQTALGITGVDTSSFPGDEVDPVTGFSDDSTDNMITTPLAQAYFNVAATVAASAAPVVTQKYSCLGTAPITAACAQQFVNDYGAQLFRRPLTSAETTEYSMFLTSQSALDPAATAVASTLQAMLLAPSFEYRTELGSGQTGVTTLNENEIASLLSYSIIDGPPDAELLQDANAGMLTDATVRETEANRLMAMPAAQAKLSDFWQQYLSLGAISPTTDITQQLATDMVQETVGFFNQVVWAPTGGTLNDLITAQYTYAAADVAKFYGASAPAASGMVTLPMGQRTGFLTQASVLIGTSAPSQAATVIHRGLLVRTRLLCEPPGNPPANFTPNPSMIDLQANATAAQNYALFAMQNPSCNACHQDFQPLGLAFETYDTEGKYRTAYPAPISQPIVTSGTLTSAGDATGPYSDVIDMASLIGPSKIGQYCFTDQFAQYAFGREVDLVQEACTIRTMGDFVTSNGAAVRELFPSLAHVDSAYQRYFQ